MHFSLFTRTIYTNNSHFHLGDAPGSVPQPKITFPPCTPDCDNKCVDMCPDYCCVKGMIRKETGQTAEIVHSSQVIIGIKVVVKRISQKRGQGKVFCVTQPSPILYVLMLPTLDYSYRDDLLRHQPPPPPFSPSKKVKKPHPIYFRLMCVAQKRLCSSQLKAK